MIQFVHPEYLYLLFLIPLLIGLFAYSQWRKEQLKKRIGTPRLIDELTPLRSSLRPIAKFGLLLLALALGSVLLARPQHGTQSSKDQRKGIEMIVAIDLSQSMLAEDIAPSRLERSKMLLSTLIEKMTDDKVGIVIFAAEAYPLLSITNDAVSSQLFVDRLNTDMVSAQGTNVAAAIRLADKSFTPTKDVGKAIVVITDGEDHGEGAIEAAEEAVRNGRRVFVLGVGTTQGAEIPTAEGPLSDNSGNIVRTKLNEEACKALAKAGKGVYIHLDNSNFAQDNLETQLRTLKQAESAVKSDGTANELFQYVGIAILLVLLIEGLIFEKQNPIWKRLRSLR